MKGDPLQELDARFRPAMDELFVSLRKYVRKNLKALERAATAPPTVPIPSIDEVLNRALSNLEDANRRMLEKGRELHRAAEARGIRPLDGKADPRMTRFFKALAALSRTQWIDIARRSVALRKQLEWAQLRVARVDAYVGRGDFISEELYDRTLLKPGLKARDRLLDQVVNTLPEQVKNDGEILEIRQNAKYAVVQVALLFIVYDWVLATREGQKAADCLFDVFAPDVERPTD